jgi:hypothetical protein
MLADAFRSVGCHEEPWHGGWPEDGNYRFETMPDLFVFRRSLPHAHRWPDLPAIRKQMEGARYNVQPLIIMRDWFCTIKSVIRRGYQGEWSTCESNMREGPLMAFRDLPDLIYVTYESFCRHPQFRRWLFVDKLGLPNPTLQINYANDKYYEEMRDES